MKNMFTITMLLVVSLAASLAFSAPIVLTSDIGPLTTQLGGVTTNIGTTNDAITALSLFGKLNLVIANQNLAYSPVPKTGQLSTYGADDDGALRKGLAWPATRFTVQANTNCVTDNLTGLIWARNANQFGKVTWSNALSSCNNLNYGGETDWRLPNWQELRSLIDASNYTPALPTGHPFAAVATDDYYWSSTTRASNTVYAWGVGLDLGYVSYNTKVTTYYVWPVRGGQ
jgi:hypothetical protein